MRIGARRLVRSVPVLLVLSGAFWGPAPGKEVPLQSPIIRTRRLDFLPVVPPSGPYSGEQVLSIQSARAGDFDGDGNTEILVFNDPCASESPNGTFLIHLTPGGVIESTTRAPTGAVCDPFLEGHGEMYAEGDFDGDGLLDFASWDSRTLFMQRPGGEFVESPISLPLDPVEGGPSQLVQTVDFVHSADLNRDGIPDAVVTQQVFILELPDWDILFRTNLYVFLADGQGGFVRNQKITAPDDPAQNLRLSRIVLKDFTGDGVPDYLGYVSGSQAAWKILPGDGEGHLLTLNEGLSVPSLPAPKPYGSENIIAAGDLNGDNLADLVLAWDSIWMSTGVARFTQHPLPVPSLSFHSPSASIQDVDGDGRGDLQVFFHDYAIGQACAATYLGEPDGTLGPPQLVNLPLDARGSLRMRWDEDLYPDTVYYGLPTGNNYSDLRSLSVFLSEGGTGPDQIPIPSPWSAARPMSAGDFDGDGEKDLLFAGGGWYTSARIVIYRGDGHGGFQALPDAAPPPAGGIAHALAGDFNRDGRDDVVVLTNPGAPGGQGGVALYLGQPPGEPPALLLTRMAGGNPVRAAAADLDGDGNLDLLVADKGVREDHVCTYCTLGGTVSAYMGQGGGILGDAMVVIEDNSPYWYYPGVLDIQVGRVDADGIPDLLILFSSLDSTSYNYGTWAIGLGDGCFDWPYVFHSTPTSSLFPLLPPADVNGDGLPDLGMSPAYVPYSKPDSRFAAFLGNDEEDLSLFGISSSCCTDPGRFIELDGDGRLDLMGVSRDFRSLQFGAGTGTGDFLPRGPHYAPSGLFLMQPWGDAGLVTPAPIFADFNDDGREDIVVWDSIGIYLLLNRSGRVASDPAESLLQPVSGGTRVDPEIDLAEIQARVGSYDFTGSGTPQGALVFTLSLNDWTPPLEGGAAGGISAILDGSASAGGFRGPGPWRPGPHWRERNQARRPGMKSGQFHLFLNFGEPLLDGDGDGTLDLSIANAIEEPGLEGIPLGDVSLNLRLDGGGPPFTGLRNVNLFSSVDRERGIATFVVPFEDLLAAMTPAERFAMDRGDGTGRLFLWAVSRLYSDRDRVPDTDDGEDPTIRSEVREFRFPLQDLRVPPILTFGDVIITTHRDGPLTLANHGVSPVTVSDLEMPDPTLSLPASPPFAVPGGGRIPMKLRYAPTEHAAFSGDLTFTLDDPGQPEIRMPVSGRGAAPFVEVSAESLDFGSAPVGLASGYQCFWVSNPGDTTLHVDWEILDPEAQFSFSPSSYYLPPPEERSFAVAPDRGWSECLYFRPNRLGLSEATFRMHTNDPFHPQVDVVMRGTGTPPEPRISIKTGCYGTTIQNVPLGEEGSVTCRVSNDGSAPLHILSITSSRPEFSGFVEPATIEPGSEGILTVTYRPVAWGLFSSIIRVASDDPTHPTVGVTIQGQAFEPPPLGHVSRTLLDFGEVHQGDSAVLSFEISNTGAGPLWLTGSSPVLYSSCAFQADLSLPGLVLPGESLTVHVTFTADIDKTLCTSFHFHTNDPALSTVTITLKAKILSPLITWTPTSLTFPATPVGKSSKMYLAVTNIGADALWISKVSFGRPEFTLDGPLPPPIPIGERAYLPVIFKPGSTGYFNSYMDIYTNDLSRRRVSIPLYATGVLATSLTTTIQMTGD